MTPYSDRHSDDIDYEAMSEVAWIGVPVFTLAGFVLWLIISQSM
jgi:hypothetical protein